MSDAQIPDDELKALEREVGDLLAEAESLGDQLVAEVGISPTARQPDDRADAADVFSEIDVSGHLANAEAAVHDAATQLGAAPPSPPVKKVTKISLPPRGAAPPSRTPSPSTAPVAPTLPDPSPPASTAAAPSPPATRGAPAIAPGAKAAVKVRPDGVERLIAGRVDQPVVELPPRPALSDRIRALLPLAAVGRIAGGTLRAIVVVLECLDRPFQRMSYGVRAALGWCALAMLTAAGALYFFVVR